jgi:hypothetical protein
MLKADRPLSARLRHAGSLSRAGPDVRLCAHYPPFSRMQHHLESRRGGSERFL